MLVTELLLLESMVELFLIVAELLLLASELLRDAHASRYQDVATRPAVRRFLDGGNDGAYKGSSVSGGARRRRAWACDRRPAQLQNGFYTGKCRGNDVEAVVRGIVKARFAQDSAIVAHLLRLLFHECGVNGCDGGLLIDGTGTEKTASPNLSVKGYDLIATIKMELERRCPGVVSCSDIEILATRDAVNASTGQGYAVRTGAGTAGGP
ncbi:hypothetical protein ZWY2020_017645 [Hordeum vulgare]|nr:hypothetical protein ZWY2020_017645 [Hordeum vulgare]